MIETCAVCANQLEESFGAPYGATFFISHGNYGSTVYDPPNMTGASEEYLRLYICDPCLLESAARGSVQRVTVQPAPPPLRGAEPWNPRSAEHEVPA